MNERRPDRFITIDGREAEVAESGGKCFFSILLNQGQVPQYRREALQNECCPDLLPMRFVDEEGGLRAYYDFGSRVQLKDIHNIWKREGKNLAMENIGAVIAVIHSALSAENYLFCCADFRLHADAIFIHPETGAARLAYIPEMGPCASSSSKLLLLIRDTARIAGDEQWDVYADEICERISSRNEPMSAIEKILKDKGRVACDRQWPNKSELRRQED